MARSTIARFARSRAGLATGAALVAGALTAVWVEAMARRAVRAHPPTGQFIEVDGVRLHYVERGEGPPVVLVHGNAVTLTDFEGSGLIDRLARDHRVIAFDRPGFGHSQRPRDRLWTPTAQAQLLHQALEQLGIGRAVVLGHSMGTMIALALALDHPLDVRRLVLLGGYYYPTLRVDALLTAPVALPVVGDAMRYTVTALSGRAMLGTMVKGMFAPADVPPAFYDATAREMMLRPLQLRANAEDAAFMIPAAHALAKRYGDLSQPVSIFAGADDKVVAHKDHAERLHAELPYSELTIVPGSGHMVHYLAGEAIAAAVDKG